MKTHVHPSIWPLLLALAFALLVSALVIVEGAGSTGSPAPVAQEEAGSPDSACSGGPTIDGVKLDECHKRTFVVGGVNKSVTVWYTKKTTSATRTLSNGTTVTLSHWINTDAQAQQVAAWGQEAWQRYFAIYNRGPYDKGCNNNINVQMEDGVGWSGIAYWASPGDCWIGIDSPMVRGGGGQWVVYHEFQHYEQYAFDDGCYAYLKAHYNSGAADGDAEFVEGYADLAADAVDAALDLTGYAGITYPPETGMYNLGYGNLYNKYFMEQTGASWLPSDPWHHMDAVRQHYTSCDAADNLYVLDTLIPALKPGRSEESLFMDFFAANWAKDWANPATQLALVYTDDDTSPYAAIPLAQNVNIASGTTSWAGQMTPDRWAGKYYQVKPQSGCNFVTAKVDGAAGATLGINLMAAKTSVPTKVSRTSAMGEDLSRTFPAYGVNDRIVASINAFNTKYGYDVSFACVSPALDILEPKQANPAQVGDPTSPIAFLARFKITSGGSPVLGVIDSQISAQAEGDPVQVVPGSLQQVGMEYWATMIPPVKPASTQKVDLKICLSGGACDTETDALLYEVPGKTDFALVFDASGSMSLTDTPGEGSRLENAKKAGTLLADLLRDGDRIAVTDFSAFNNPTGCGLPAGSGNCALDIRTRLARTDVTVPATINAAKNAINLISARDWTPIGAALLDGKNKLQAAPYSLNPKHVILLSDGEENVNPLYATVRNELIASGVIIDTIGLSGDAPEPLLAQIASDTGGTYRFVPTSSSGLSPENVASLDNQRSFLLSQGATPEMVDAMQAALLPGPLALDDVYDYLETKSQQASRLFWTNNNGVATNEWRTASTVVDESVNILRLVASSKQEDYDNSCGSSRFVEVLRPGAGPRDWIPISPRTALTPLNWDIRNSIYDDVVMIPNPELGVWQIRSKWVYNLCAPTENPEALVFDVMMTGSAETNLSVQGRFLDPIVNNKGAAGDIVPIVATVMDRNGARPGALVLAAVARPNGGDLLLLLDDGQHHDGGANDGIYGYEYPLTTVGGTYNVTIGAWIYDQGTGQWLTRNWMGAFWINGPEADDLDGDGMPDRWERRCKLDTSADDTALDNDLDLLTNWQEFQLGTLPCDSDTDNGGEIDSSEVLANRNPRWALDDQVRPVAHFNVSALNQRIRIEWTHPLSYTTMLGWFIPLPDGLTNPVDMGSTGVFTATGAVNGQEYLVALMGVNGNAFGGYTDISSVMPKADPDAPNGAILINNGAKTTGSRNVTLSLSSDDVPLPGLAESANAHAGGPLALQYNEVSGSAEMRISNRMDFAGAAWEPLAFTKAWTLLDGPDGPRRVYAQFRDAAGNQSFAVFDDIIYRRLYMPFVKRR